VPSCPPHHWIIATPNGVTSCGVCKRCGTEREFANAPDRSAPAVGLDRKHGGDMMLVDVDWMKRRSKRGGTG